MPRKVAAMIVRAWPGFPARAFLRHALDGYEALDLMARGRHVAGALARTLPADFPRAADILVASLGPALDRSGGNGMAPFLYLPHGFFVAENGLEHFEPSMRAQYEITQRFTAEFSIRPFLAVKRGDRHALGILGFGGEPKVAITRAALVPKRVRLGGEVQIAFDLTSTHDADQRVLVDFRVFFVKAGGASAPKVFKLKSIELAPRQTLRLAKRLSLAEMTTRKHYRGVHRVEAIVNGRAYPLGAFQVI